MQLFAVPCSCVRFLTTFCVSLRFPYSCLRFPYSVLRFPYSFLRVSYSFSRFPYRIVGCCLSNPYREKALLRTIEQAPSQPPVAQKILTVLNTQRGKLHRVVLPSTVSICSFFTTGTVEKPARNAKFGNGTGTQCRMCFGA